MPDHQEIFINNDRSDLEARNSLIISLCEEVTDPSKTNHGALIYHILDQLDEDGPCLGLGETVQRTMATFPYVQSPILCGMDEMTGSLTGVIIVAPL